MILDNDDGIDVAGEASDIVDMLGLVEREKPDVILLDLALTDGTSMSAIPKILKIHPDARILVFTGIVDEDIHKKALLSGAHGVLLKHHAGSVLVRAIKKVHDGEAWIDRHLTAKVLHEAAHKENARSAFAAKLATLTPRERQIVLLITDGHNNQSIAHHLNISEKTVRNRLTDVYSKLEVTSRLELALLASAEDLS
jgi:RNA polymerase sigma factor (sigma-70 family)